MIIIVQVKIVLIINLRIKFVVNEFSKFSSLVGSVLINYLSHPMYC